MKFAVLIVVGVVVLLIFLVRFFFVKKNEWKGYFGYQVAGQGETTVILKQKTDLISYAMKFATGSLGMSKEEAYRQLQASLEDGCGEIHLVNGLGEIYHLKGGEGNTVIRTMINERPVKKESPDRRFTED